MHWQVWQKLTTVNDRRSLKKREIDHRFDRELHSLYVRKSSDRGATSRAARHRTKLQDCQQDSTAAAIFAQKASPEIDRRSGVQTTQGQVLFGMPHISISNR